MKRVIILMLCSMPASALHWSSFPGRFNCPDILNAYRCARSIEADLNKSFVQRVDSSRVDVSLSNGGNRSFSGDWSVLEASASDRFLALYLPQFEAHTFALFDRNSNVLHELDGYPVLSPDGRWVAEANTDLDAGWSPNVLKIYRVSGASLDLVFSADPEGWGPEEVTWQSSSELTYVRATVDCYYLKANECVSVTATFDGDEWQ